MFVRSSVDPVHINEILNFQFNTFTMSLIRMNQLISKNVLQFRKDFKIEKLFRIKNRGKEKCYVIVSNLKPYWITLSLDNFLYGWKKIKLFDEQTSGVFIWVRLTKNDTHQRHYKISKIGDSEQLCFELKQNGFKYCHDSYYFDAYQKADEFIEEVKNINNRILNGGNRNLYAPERDIITQTYGMEKSVHIIYPIFLLRQLELDQGSKFEKSLAKKSSLAEADMHGLNSDLDFLLFGESQLLFRLLKRVRTDGYFVLNYTWLYQKLQNWNPFSYEITHSEEKGDAVQSKEISKAPSIEKTTQSKVLIRDLPCKNFKKYS